MTFSHLYLSRGMCFASINLPQGLGCSKLLPYEELSQPIINMPIVIIWNRPLRPEITMHCSHVFGSGQRRSDSCTDCSLAVVQIVEEKGNGWS